jgi:hypothetical protein
MGNYKATKRLWRRSGYADHAGQAAGARRNVHAMMMHLRNGAYAGYAVTRAHELRSALWTKRTRSSGAGHGPSIMLRLENWSTAEREEFRANPEWVIEVVLMEFAGAVARLCSTFMETKLIKAFMRALDLDGGKRRCLNMHAGVPCNIEKGTTTISRSSHTFSSHTFVGAVIIMRAFFEAHPDARVVLGKIVYDQHKYTTTSTIRPRASSCRQSRRSSACLRRKCREQKCKWAEMLRAKQ